MRDARNLEAGKLRRMRESVANATQTHVANASGQYFRRISDLKAPSEHRFLTSAALLCTVSAVPAGQLH